MQHYSLSSLIKASSVDYHPYADDTKLFISFSPRNFSDSIDHLLLMVKQILLEDLKSSMPELEPCADVIVSVAAVNIGRRRRAPPPPPQNQNHPPAAAPSVA